MTLTLANIPLELDEALRKKAIAEGKALDEVALDAMRTGLGLSNGGAKLRDLSDIAGTWISDPEVEAALRDQDRVDPEMWK
jgi:hypothetical protein